MDVAASLRERLATSGAAPREHIDAVVALHTAQGERRHLATVVVEGDAVRIEPAPLADADADATFTFDSAGTALSVLCGDADPIAAFSAGRFRADGHLPLVFVVLGLFRAEYGGGPPP